ncbi:hypothetical protein GCM10022200_20530 [Microbacterium awajiense]|uniref:3-carboxymuconate cyclase n=1 Tax=Microbacterium awajiense TaxID=415214 RepID=A0ABP7APX4_9MICO
MRLWLGGYTADMDGSATGIGMLRVGADDEPGSGGRLGFDGDAVASGGSPSWLAAHPSRDVVYAALEGAGAVQAFRRTGPTALVRLGEPVDAGDAVCHLAVSPAGDRLIASCWGDGRVVSMDLDASGRPSAPKIAVAAVDPYDGESAAAPASAAGPDIDLAAAARALREAAGDEYAHLVPDHDAAADADGDGDGDADAGASGRSSHSHQARYLPGGLIATTDMGFDLVRFWRDGGAGLRAHGEVVLPRGVGPRHMLWHPSGHLYVIAELACEVFVLSPDADGTWRVRSSTPLVGTLADDTAAEITASRDGHVVHASARGSDTVATLRVRGDGDRLDPVALVEAGTHWPRHHLVLGDTMLIAGQLGEEVVSRPLDERTGVPGRIRHRVAVPSPTCLLPAR